MPVAVLDTPDGGHLWIRPVGKPEDATFPLGYAAGLATLAMIFFAGHVQRSRAHTRLSQVTHGVPLAMTIDARHRAIISAPPSRAALASVLLQRAHERRQDAQRRTTADEACQLEPSPPGPDARCRRSSSATSPPTGGQG
jgi:hypothetical protein